MSSDLTKILPESLRPLPTSLRGIECALCRKKTASWAAWSFLPDDPTELSICSLCFIYDTVWSKSNSDVVAKIVDEVEKSRGDVFKRDSDSRLEMAAQADHVLGVIVLASKVSGPSRILDVIRNNFQ